VQQLVNDPNYLAAADAQIPAEFRVPRMDSYPLFVQADFGIVKTAEGGYEPKLVEIQGFPSLYAYQVELAKAYSDVYEFDYPYLLDSLSESAYRELLTAALLNGKDAENVVLLEIDPLGQKTLPDFLLTKRYCGIEVVNIRDVRKRDNRLFYQRAGRETPIHRIYNRAIADELIRKQVPLEFDFRDDLNVEWAGHPNWFFRISKFSLPFLQHASVPTSRFLSDVREIPDDPERFVLKPLFSFAGLGVIVGPTHEEIEGVPEELRSSYLLQERVRFEPVIQTPHGDTNAEVRIMYVGSRAVTTIIRMGRGKMMGVDHNRDLAWVGASAGFVC
jgi:hypothetical protein